MHDMQPVKLLVSMLAAASLCACSTAKKASEVSAVRVPVAPYLKMSCDELGTEQRVLHQKVEYTRQAVDESHSSDKGKELVAWLLFAPVAFALEGNQKQATDFAVAKGTQDAIQEAMLINKCQGAAAIPTSTPSPSADQPAAATKS